MQNTIREVIVRLALSSRGIPYIWGGATPAHGFDCSGFIVWLLQVAGTLKRGDWTAQNLADVFGPPFTPGPLQPHAGDLVVYGRSRLEITHVMFLTTPTECTGASGGGHRTTDRNEALRIGANVHTRDWNYRKDFVGFLLIPYPDEL